MLKVASADPFNRPADTTAYASGDLVANSTTAGSVVAPSIALNPANGGLGRIRRCKLKKSGTSVTNAAFRVHLFRTAPTVTNGDNGVWLPTESGYVGSFDVTVDKAFSDGAVGLGLPTVGTDITFSQPADKKRLFILLEARGAYTPASAETFTVSLELDNETPNPYA